jgi:hypothetical protein
MSRIKLEPPPLSGTLATTLTLSSVMNGRKPFMPAVVQPCEHFLADGPFFSIRTGRITQRRFYQHFRSSSLSLITLSWIEFASMMQCLKSSCYCLYTCFKNPSLSKSSRKRVLMNSSGFLFFAAGTRLATSSKAIRIPSTLG